jgi:maltooligosyltrehalose trehalohydrolase
MGGLGACYLGNHRCRFRVWAPKADTVGLFMISPRERRLSMARDERGYYEVESSDVEPGSLYFYRLNGAVDRADPASRFQPRGVHGPSAVVDPSFDWSPRLPERAGLRDFIVYELHVGTFSAEGTFDGAVARLDEIVSLGATAVELMPVAQFPGDRNWGYDGVFPFAVQVSYGGPSGMRRLVDACHRRGLSVVLDVVYNHLGPEGNYLPDFAPYFTDAYRTPWGDAVNFDGAFSDEVRRYFIDNALYWADEFHIDALRLDAVHAIIDRSPYPFLQELADRAGDRIALIAESDANDNRIVRPPPEGGWGLRAQWNDDFHHALHTLLTGESAGYYEDFGSIDHLKKAFEEGFVYSGGYSTYRKRRHGSPSASTGTDRLVVFSQNHDQVGNRMLGERLGVLVSFEALKLAAGAVLLSPYVPLLFMGEEYGETSPFLYFTSHTDPALIEAVREGRRREFAAFGWPGAPPDPQAVETFERSKLTRHHDGVLLDFYKELIRVRRGTAALRHPSKADLTVERFGRCLVVAAGPAYRIVMNFAREKTAVTLPPGAWNTLVDSASARWGGPGSAISQRERDDDGAVVEVGATSVVVFERVQD